MSDSTADTVTAIVAHFHRAYRNFQKWRSQKKRGRQSAEKELEDSLDVGADEVEFEYKKLRCDHGLAFEQGDDVSQKALKKIESYLKSSIVDPIESSLGADRKVTFRAEALWHVSEQARKHALLALTELARRITDGKLVFGGRKDSAPSIEPRRMSAESHPRQRADSYGLAPARTWERRLSQPPPPPPHPPFREPSIQHYENLTAEPLHRWDDHEGPLPRPYIDPYSPRHDQPLDTGLRWDPPMQNQVPMPMRPQPLPFREPEDDGEVMSIEANGVSVFSPFPSFNTPPTPTGDPIYEEPRAAAELTNSPRSSISLGQARRISSPPSSGFSQYSTTSSATTAESFYDAEKFNDAPIRPLLVRQQTPSPWTVERSWEQQQQQQQPQCQAWNAPVSPPTSPPPLFSQQRPRTVSAFSDFGTRVSDYNRQSFHQTHEDDMRRAIASRMSIRDDTVSPWPDSEARPRPVSMLSDLGPRPYDYNSHGSFQHHDDLRNETVSRLSIREDHSSLWAAASIPRPASVFSGVDLGRALDIQQSLQESRSAAVSRMSVHDGAGWGSAWREDTMDVPISPVVERQQSLGMPHAMQFGGLGLS